MHFNIQSYSETKLHMFENNIISVYSNSGCHNNMSYHVSDFCARPCNPVYI